jgi:ferredoxin
LKRLAADSSRCTGCGICETVCSKAWRKSEDKEKSAIRIYATECVDHGAPVSDRIGYVASVSERIGNGASVSERKGYAASVSERIGNAASVSERKGYVASVCDQCGICADMCSNMALTRDGNGVIRLDKGLCVGCLICVGECVRDNMRYCDDLPAPFKCTACGLCAKQCPSGALSILEE